MDEPVPPAKPRRRATPVGEAAAAPPLKPPRRRSAAAPASVSAPPTDESPAAPAPRRRASRAKPVSTTTEPTPAPPSAPPRRRSRVKAEPAATVPSATPDPTNTAADAPVDVAPPPRTLAAPAARPADAAPAAAPQAVADQPRAPSPPVAVAERAAVRPSADVIAAASPSAGAPPTAAATVTRPAVPVDVPAVARPAAHPRAAGDTPGWVPSFARPAVAPSPAARTRTASRPADGSARSTRLIEVLLARLPARRRERTREYLVLMRLDRPVGALLLLWPTWWALWFAANDFPPVGPLVIFTLGVFVMRSAGCVINDYADHGWLDAQVERTRERPMAAGRVSKKEALTLFAGLLAFAFVLVLFTNTLTILLSFVGAALAAIYPFTKRVTHLAQVVLGAAFGWSIPMAFAAVTHSLPPLCWLLFLANVLFSTVYDTEYAMVDREDDLRAGAKSTAILFGDADRVIIGVLMATFLFAMLLAGSRAHLPWPYGVAVALAAGLFGYQQWLMRARERAACFAAFRNNNLVGLVLWVGLVLAVAIR